jgi:hypothetical protein
VSRDRAPSNTALPLNILFGAFHHNVLNNIILIKFITFLGMRVWSAADVKAQSSMVCDLKSLRNTN